MGDREMKAYYVKSDEGDGGTEGANKVGRRVGRREYRKVWC